MSAKVEIAARVGDRLGESAFWDARRARLWWVDIPFPSKLHQLDPATGRTREWAMPEMVTCVRAARDGRTLIAACHTGLARIDAETGAFERLYDPEPHRPFNRGNDGATDPRGRFWFGTMQNNYSPDGGDYPLIEDSGALYRLDADLKTTLFEDNIGVSNSTAFSPDGRVMYFCDTRRGVIWAYDYDLETGVPSNRREFARHELGHPDGSTVDAEGGLWNARWGGGCVVRYTPDGRYDRVIELPTAKVTSCAFGGAGLEWLFITTAGGGPGASDPNAGHLYVCRPGVRGVEAAEFG